MVIAHAILVVLNTMMWVLTMYLGYLSVSNEGGGEYWIVNLPLSILLILVFIAHIPTISILPAGIYLLMNRCRLLGILSICLVPAILILGIFINAHQDLPTDFAGYPAAISYTATILIHYLVLFRIVKIQKALNNRMHQTPVGAGDP